MDSYKNSTEKTATQDELRYLGDKYPYQALVIPLLDQVMQCLSTPALKTWLALFSRKNYYTGVVSYDSEEIAKRTGLSRRSVQRHIQEILEHQLLLPTKYHDNLSNSYSEFQMTFPREFCNNTYEGNQRSQAEPDFENSTRDYNRDEKDNIRFTSYINGNDTAQINISDKNELDKIVGFIEQGYAAEEQAIGMPAEVTVEEAAQPVSECIVVASVKPVELAPENKAEIESEIEQLNEKIDSEKMTMIGKMHLIGERQQLAVQLKEPEPSDKNDAIPLTIYVNKKQRKNTTALPHVNPPARKNNRYFSEDTKPNVREPICYRDNIETTVPEKYVSKVKQAITDNRESISNPPGVLKEILWCIARFFVGKPGDKPNATQDDIFRFNTCAAIKIIRANKWTTPGGLRPKDVIAAKKKTEVDKENKLRWRNNHNGYVPTPMAMADLKAVLGI